MSGLVFRFMALWFVAASGGCCLYSYARARRSEAGLYAVACVAVLWMVATAVNR